MQQEELVYRSASVSVELMLGVDWCYWGRRTVDEYLVYPGLCLYHRGDDCLAVTCYVHHDLFLGHRGLYIVYQVIWNGRFGRLFYRGTGTGTCSVDGHCRDRRGLCLEVGLGGLIHPTFDDCLADGARGGRRS